MSGNNSIAVSTIDFPIQSTAALHCDEVPRQMSENYSLNNGRVVKFDCYALYTKPEPGASNIIDMLQIEDELPGVGLYAEQVADPFFHETGAGSRLEKENADLEEFFRAMENFASQNNMFSEDSPFLKSTINSATAEFNKHCDWTGRAGHATSQLPEQYGNPLVAVAEMGRAARFVFANIVGSVGNDSVQLFVSDWSSQVLKGSALELPSGRENSRQIGLLEMFTSDYFLKLRLALRDGRAHIVYQISDIDADIELTPIDYVVAKDLGEALVPVVEFARECAVAMS